MAKPDLSHITPDLRALAVPLERIQLDPENVRLHPERNIEAIMASYRRFGQRKPIVVNRTTGRGTTIDGNGQLIAAMRLGWTHIAVTWVDDDEDTAKAYAIAANQTGLSSQYDYQQLAAQVQELSAAGMDIAVLGFADFELEPLLQASWVPPALVETPAEEESSSAKEADEQEGEEHGTGTPVVWSPHALIEISDEAMPVVQAALARYREESGNEDLDDGTALVRVCQAYMDMLGSEV